MECKVIKHTVNLDPDKCKGCISCMRRCPTEAIRVRNGKAKVFYERCVGCGECVRICPHQAKLPIHDPFDIIFNYKYRIALPAPALFGQFNNLEDIDVVLNGLLAIGFDDVYEVSRGAELVSEATRVLLKEGKLKRPVLSSACPAVTDLILLEFHGLADHIIDLQAPAEVAARLARERAIAQGVPPEDIGVFFISPCPAKVHALNEGATLTGPAVDGVLAISEVYFKLVPAMSKLTEIKKIGHSGMLGVRWAASGGESEGTENDKYLAADGIENVITILREIENGKLNYIDFVELNACTGGCVGGVLNIENPFVAKARIRSLKKNLSPYRNTLADESKDMYYCRWEKMPELKDVYCIDKNRIAAIKKMDKIEKLLDTLPKIDCGSCGAPSCRAFAEDVVNGDVEASGCVRKHLDTAKGHNT